MAQSNVKVRMKRSLAIALMVGICINVQGVSWYRPKDIMDTFSKGVGSLSKMLGLMKNYTVRYTKSFKTVLHKPVQSMLAFVHQNPKKTCLLGMSAAAVATACWLGWKKLRGIWLQANKVPDLEKGLKDAKDAAKDKIEKLKQKKAALKERLAALQTENGTLDRQLNAAREENRINASKVDPVEHARTVQNLALATKERDDARLQVQALLQLKQQLEEIVTNRQKELDLNNRMLEEQKMLLAGRDQMVADLQGKEQRIQELLLRLQRVEQLETDFAQLSKEKKILEEDLTKVKEENAQYDQFAADTMVQVDQLEKEIAGLRAEKERLEAAIAIQDQQIKDADKKIDLAISQSSIHQVPSKQMDTLSSSRFGTASVEENTRSSAVSPLLAQLHEAKTALNSVPQELKLHQVAQVAAQEQLKKLKSVQPAPAPQAPEKVEAQQQLAKLKPVGLPEKTAKQDASDPLFQKIKGQGSVLQPVGVNLEASAWPVTASLMVRTKQEAQDNDAKETGDTSRFDHKPVQVGGHVTGQIAQQQTMNEKSTELLMKRLGKMRQRLTDSIQSSAIRQSSLQSGFLERSRVGGLLSSQTNS